MTLMTLANMYLGILIGSCVFFSNLILNMVHRICCHSWAFDFDDEPEHCFGCIVVGLGFFTATLGTLAALIGCVYNWVVSLSAFGTVIILCAFPGCYLLCAPLSSFILSTCKWPSKRQAINLYADKYHRWLDEPQERYDSEIWNFLKSIDYEFCDYYDGFKWNLGVGTMDQVMKLTEQDLRNDLAMKQEHIDEIMKKIYSFKRNLVFGYIREIERKYALSGVVPNGVSVICLDYFIEIESDDEDSNMIESDDVVKWSYVAMRENRQKRRGK